MELKPLKQRWNGIDKLDFRSSPFGVTDEGRKDFRGLDLQRYRPRHKTLKGRRFEKCDFSFSDGWPPLDRSVFLDCLFRRAILDNWRDWRNRFENCLFSHTLLRCAGIGSWTSRYEDCTFEKCNFAKASFDNPIFRRVVFRNNKLAGAHFNVSGFWDCVFEGPVRNVWFRGRYPRVLEAESIFWRPKETGLHNVDFSKASLADITMSDECALENIILPEGGEAMLCDVRKLLDSAETMLHPHFNQEEWGVIGKYVLDILAVHARTQAVSILSRQDTMVKWCGKGVGVRLYDLMRNGGPWSVQTANLEESSSAPLDG